MTAKDIRKWPPLQSPSCFCRNSFFYWVEFVLTCNPIPVALGGANWIRITKYVVAAATIWNHIRSSGMFFCPFEFSISCVPFPKVLPNEWACSQCWKIRTQWTWSPFSSRRVNGVFSLTNKKCPFQSQFIRGYRVNYLIGLLTLEVSSSVGSSIISR